MELEEKDLELIDKEFITDQFDTYESDLVYKVYTKEGVVYLFFLLELFPKFQSADRFDRHQLLSHKRWQLFFTLNRIRKIHGKKVYKKKVHK